MQQAIINKELIGEEPLYHTKNDDYDNWYYCKYFALAADYCFIAKDVKVENNNGYFYEECYLQSSYDYSEYTIYFQTFNGEEYAMLEYPNITYKIPFKFYKNIIENMKESGCGIYACDCTAFASAQNKPIVFVDYYGEAGRLNPCAFEIYKIADDDYYIEQDKLVPTEIEDNFIFEDITMFINGISRVKYNGICAKLDLNGNIIQKLICEDCQFVGEYTKIKLGGKWGVIDLSNNFVIAPKYEKIIYKKNNKWKVSLNGKEGFIDNNENILISIDYTEIYYYTDNFFLVCKWRKWGLIDINENIVIPFEYDVLEQCYIKEHYFYAIKNGKTGIIDIDNNIIIPFEYEKLVYLNSNTIAAKLDENRFILINEKNEQICSQIFDDIHSNIDDIDIYPAKLNGLWGFIDKFGNKKINFKYTDALYFHNGYCSVSIKENPQECDYGLINSRGEVILDYKYDFYFQIIDDDRFIVGKNFEPVIVDRKGNIIVDKLYLTIWHSDNDNKYLKATLDKYKGFIDKNGKPLKINKETLNIPITTINYNYDNLSQKDKIFLLFDGKEL